MSAAGFILVFSILISIAIVVVMFVGLFRQGKRVLRAGMDLAEAAAPVVDEISAEGERASLHAAALAERAATIRS